MKIFVTGASGGLGQHLFRYLANQKNCEIKVLVRISQGCFPGGAIVNGDLLDRNTLVEATKSAELVVHLAALNHSNSSEDYFRVNVDGTRNLLDACAINGVQRFIYVSLHAAHPDGGSYSESKLKAEELVKNSGLPWVILRPTEVFGQNSTGTVNKLIKWIQSSPVVPSIGNGRFIVCPVYIDDVISAVGQCIFDSEMVGKTLFLSGPEEMTYVELVDRICHFAHVKRLKIFIPFFLLRALVEVLDLLGWKFVVRDQIPRLLCKTYPSFDPLVKLQNYHPRTLEQGLGLYLKR